MKNNKKWISFLSTLEGFHNTSNVLFCEVIIDWLKTNKRAFMTKDWEENNFHLLTQLNPEEFYVEVADITPSARLAQLKKFSKNLKNKTMLMLINSMLMQYLTLETGDECPNCESSDYVYLSSLDGKYIILSCNECTFETIANHDIELTGPLDVIPASRSQIIQFKSERK